MGDPRLDRIEGWTAVAMGMAAMALYVVAYQLPFWQFTLHAPQYPEGLDLVIYLDHLGGRVREINGLNHYIGMAKLQEAAQFERESSHWGIGALVALVGVGLIGGGLRWKWLTLAPAIGFPLIFIGDMFYWLYMFGNNLSPRAPIEIPGFTPSMFGEGKIGQFATYAYPGTGFWLAVAAAGLVVGALWLRRSVCSRCSRKPICGLTCPRLVVRTDDAEKFGPAAEEVG